MTIEARIAFVLLFAFAWAFFGLLAWAVLAVIRRGRGAVLALPLALAGAVAAGFLLPLAGLRDATGFFLSFPAALLGGGALAYAGARISDALGLAPADRPLRDPPPRE